MSSPYINRDPRGYSGAQSGRDQFIDRLMSAPKIGANAVTQFIVTADATTKGVNVTFGLTSTSGIGSVTLLRSGASDVAQGIVLQTWSASVSTFTWSDTDVLLKSLPQAYYFLKLEPSSITGSEVVVGPQFILLNPSLVAPTAATSISASHGDAANGVVLVTCNVAGIPSGESVKITVTGYLGNPAPVAIAQRASSPLQFTMEATGETVTLTALVVSSGGTPATSGPTTTLILNGSATVPAVMQGITVAQLSAGNQVQWPTSREVGVTSYQLYRGQRGDSFLLATLLATVAQTSVGTIEYLDTAGLGGDYQYFVIVVAASGNSSPSDPAFPPVLFSSASIPPNVASNTTNTATIDSVDLGVNVLVRIYGPGGVGTGYTRLTGFGTLTRPNGSVSGLAYTTTYYVLYTGSAYLATTTYPSTLPDGYEFVGTILTTGPTSPAGSGATATAVIDATSGVVIQINSTANGSGYLAATVNISGGGGSGASATANISSGHIPSYTVTNGGSGYTSAPGVTIVPGAGSGTVGGGGTVGSPKGSRLGVFLTA